MELNDGMFTLRQLEEKMFEMQGEMILGDVNLEKACDCPERDDDGNAEMDGSAGGRSWVGARYV